MPEGIGFARTGVKKIMLDLTTVSMMIVLSSITLAVLTGFWGRAFWNEGGSQLTLGLVLFGAAYSCLSFLGSPLRPWLFGVGYVAFACGICASIASLHRFYRIPLTTAWLYVLPVCTGVVYFLLVDQAVPRIRTLSGMLILYNLWLAQLLLRRHNALGRGEWMFLGGVVLLTVALVLRIFSPQLSLSTLAPSNSSSSALLLSYAVLFIALHLKVIGFLIMAQARANQQLLRFACEDSLTGLPNRRTVMQALQQVLDQPAHQRADLAVLLMDIDHFKRVNDQCGHPAGDQVLAGLGHILRQQLRPLSVAGRYGGEEFIVVCPDTTAEQALQLANRLCDAARSQLRAQHAAGSWPVTISVGISALPAGSAAITSEALLQQADEALYQAKHAGRDQVCLFGTAAGATDGADAADSLGLVTLGLSALRFPERFVRKRMDSSAEK